MSSLKRAKRARIKSYFSKIEPFTKIEEKLLVISTDSPDFKSILAETGKQLKFQRQLNAKRFMHVSALFN